MKKLLLGLIVCALLVGMTGVVSACIPTTCQVNGGGTVDDCNDGFITVAFNAKGMCYSDDVKGMVNIVYHDSKKKVKFDVVKIEKCCLCDKSPCIKLTLNGEKCKKYYLKITDNGEGSNAPCDDYVEFYYCNSKCHNGYEKFKGYLSGNAQIRTKEIVPV